MRGVCICTRLVFDSCQGESRLWNGIDFGWRELFHAEILLKPDIKWRGDPVSTARRNAAQRARSLDPLRYYKGKLVVARNLHNFRKRENVFSLGSPTRLLNDPSVMSATRELLRHQIRIAVHAHIRAFIPIEAFESLP